MGLGPPQQSWERQQKAVVSGIIFDITFTVVFYGRKKNGTEVVTQNKEDIPPPGAATGGMEGEARST